jgi:hypothetical protein
MVAHTDHTAEWVALGDHSAVVVDHGDRALAVECMAQATAEVLESQACGVAVEDHSADPAVEWVVLGVVDLAEEWAALGAADLAEEWVALGVVDPAEWADHLVVDHSEADLLAEAQWADHGDHMVEWVAQWVVWAEASTLVALLVDY